MKAGFMLIKVKEPSQILEQVFFTQAASMGDSGDIKTSKFEGKYQVHMCIFLERNIT